jgi:hypothetical protein
VIDGNVRSILDSAELRTSLGFDRERGGNFSAAAALFPQAARRSARTMRRPAQARSMQSAMTAYAANGLLDATA